MKRMSKADKDAAKLVAEYVERFMVNYGLVPKFPQLVVGFEKSIHGFGVRHGNNYAQIAHFSTYEIASCCISRLHRVYLDRQYAAALRNGLAS